MFASLLTMATLAAVWEYRSWASQKRYREIVFGACLLGVGVLLGVLRLLHLPVPTPIYTIRTLFNPASRWLEALLS